MGCTFTYGRFDAKAIDRARKSKRAAEELVDEVIAAETDNILEDIEKGWDALHLALSEERRRAKEMVEQPTDLLGKAVWGGAPLRADLEDDGYGPPRFLAPEEVRAIAAALAELDEAKVRAAFDPGRKDLYRRCDADEVAEMFVALRDFYGDAAGEGEGVVVVFA
jgi:hypothetical protein